MFIQSYQIHNVLNVYRKQLSQKISDQPQQKSGQKTKLDVSAITNELKKQSIMEKVAENVLKKIATIDFDTTLHQEESKRDRNKKNESNGLQRENIFTFNTIVGRNQKKTCSISVNDSHGLMNQLNQLAKMAIRRKADQVCEAAGPAENRCC